MTRAENFWTGTAASFVPKACDLPSRVDAVVVGAGYTGLMAATELARGGASVLVVDRGGVGAGCSGRNGGQVGTTIKPSFQRLSKSYGRDRALAIKRLGLEAYKALRELIKEEALDVEWAETGRFLAAHSFPGLHALRDTLENQPQGAEVPFELVDETDLQAFVGSPSYVGGALFPMAGSVHPGKLVAALGRRATSAGVVFSTNTEMRDIFREGTGFRVMTARGSVACKKVLIATNGYTGRATPWLHRRIIPISSAMIATEPLEPDLINRLIPKGRMIVDTRRVVVYFRPSPDGRRIIFGGRASAADLPVPQAVPHLFRMLRYTFPELATVEAEYGWSGTVAYTFDELPHIGQQDGMYYAMGYCGSGISLSTYLGGKIGQQMLGLEAGHTPLCGLDFPTRPFYTGKPWFLRPAIATYRMLDRLSALRGASYRGRE